MGTVMSAAVSGTRYRRATAANYERRRAGQGRWKAEHEAVAEWLRGARGAVLDVPVGTGRFIPLYEEMKLRYTGLDVSEDMLEIARPRVRSRRGEVFLGDVFDLSDFVRDEYETVVCVRLLHLVSQREAERALAWMCRVAQRRVILTVRLADAPRANSSSTTHGKRWFSSTIRRLGWVVAEERVLSRAGWRIVMLTRAGGR
jgi:ubiquinone/menaquinone biosynthesis C-methylase UbiE